MKDEAPEPNANDTCVWSRIFDENASRALNTLQFSAGIGTFIFGFWLSATVMTSRKLLSDDSYRNLSTYTLAATLRRYIPGLIYFLPCPEVIYSWPRFSFLTCEFFGFWETFMAVFEIESLTMVCIERYVTAKYISKGWKVPPSHYYLYGSLCIFFAFSYAYPPLLGLGRYAKDFDCMHCTFDIILPPGGWKMYTVLFIFFMRSIKPTIMMLLMLYWAYNLEIKCKDNQAQRGLTKGVIAAASSYIISGIPITVIRGCLMASQLMYGEIVMLELTEYAIISAMVIHWSSPTLAMFCLALCDLNLRRKLTDFVDDDKPTGHEIRPRIIIPNNLANVKKKRTSSRKR